MRAFMRKEWMEWMRTGRFLILILVFTLFGIMNPAIAKLTPYLMEMLAESLEESGLVMTEVTVTAMTSWAQFYKNIPIGMIAFILIGSGNFTGEYERGTLIPVVARGLPRRKILASKAAFLYGSWTVLYLLCAGITYGYNAYFWDNGIAGNLLFALTCTWLFGMWLTALLIFFSAVGRSTTQVLSGTGGVVFGAALLGMFPKLGEILPVKLLDGMTLLQNNGCQEEYYAAMAAAGIMSILCMGLALICFDQKKL